mmetsp:Transcript_32864/g.82915  ORF Transcript_32864/g.82915 Transcript_32864/m.82915 type:complete len:213 (-) Transcript_32864:259-897(-)
MPLAEPPVRGQGVPALPQEGWFPARPQRPRRTPGLQPAPRAAHGHLHQGLPLVEGLGRELRQGRAGGAQGGGGGVRALRARRGDAREVAGVARRVDQRGGGLYGRHVRQLHGPLDHGLVGHLVPFALLLVLLRVRALVPGHPHGRAELRVALCDGAQGAGGRQEDELGDADGGGGGGGCEHLVRPFDHLFGGQEAEGPAVHAPGGIGMAMGA